MTGGGWLVSFETSGNQGYIFASNRLIESVGASHLVREATTGWVKDALRSVLPVDEDGSHQILQLSSGRALVLITGSSCDAAERLVTAVTLRALREAPGLQITGAITELREDLSVSTLTATVRSVSRQLSENAMHLPGPASRHPRLPITADCASTGRGAAQVVRAPGGGSMLVSAAVATKRSAVPAALEALRERLGEEFRLPRRLSELENLFANENAEPPSNSGLTLAGRWLAVVHADVNGLGRAVMRLDEHLDANTYLKDLPEFSRAVDQCTLRALRAALNAVPPVLAAAANTPVIPVVPLVAAGDDLTVLLPGAHALRFAATYLREVELQSAGDDVLAAGLSEERLSACAGVAFVKAHHPFSDAYRLAADLADSAKRVKRLVRGTHPDDYVPCSALDFELVRGTVGMDLMRRRAHMTTDAGRSLLHNRPYVITPADELDGAVAAESLAWVKRHQFEELDKRRAALTARDMDGTPVIPRSAVMALREVLADGREVADARARIVRARTGSISALLDDRGAVFSEAAALDDGQHVSDLLDALDVVEQAGADSILPGSGALA